MTDKFLELLFSIKKDQIPERIYVLAKQCLLDYIACSVAGAKIYHINEYKYLNSLTKEHGTCTVIGHNTKTTAQTAALINGISAHAVELDDGHRIGMLHPGAPIISALLAIAEEEQVSYNDLLYGIIIGYEAAIRLACAIQPECKLKGFHATGICGTVGGAIAIGAMLGFSFHQMKSTLAAAISSTSGLLEMIEGDTQLKPFNAGNAAMNAISAVFIGKAGFRPPLDPLGGKRGFLNAYAEGAKERYLTESSSGSYCIEKIYNKPYASCRHTHPALEAALKIRQLHNLRIDDISSIQVTTYKLAVAGHDHTNIKGVNSAKMSIPYSIAVALTKGNAGLEEYSEKMVTDPKVLDVAAKVKVCDKTEFTALCPKKRVAEVCICAKGNFYNYKVEYPKGEPENPLTSQEFDLKIAALMKFGDFSEETIERCISIIKQQKFEINDLMDLL